MAKNWKLKWGIHQHTMTSRDYGDPYKCNSLDECKKERERLKKHFGKRGYVIWFSTAYGPEGQEINLGGDSCY
jgi:hypothetical protein